MSKLQFPILNSYSQLKNFVVLTRKLRNLLSAGFDLKKSVEILLADETNPEQRIRLQSFMQKLTLGVSFVQALQELVPKTIPYQFEHIQMVPDIILFLKAIEGYYQTKLDDARQIAGKLSYPLVLLGLTGGVLVVFLVGLLPMYAQFLAGFNQSLPRTLTALLMGIEWAKHHPLILLFGLGFVGILGYSKLMVLLKKIINTLFFPQTIADVLWVLAILMENGISMKIALESISLTSDANYSQFKMAVLNGDGFTESCNRFFVLTVYQKAQLANAEKTQQFHMVLKEVALDIHMQDQRRIEQYTFWIQPILLIGLGLLIGLFLYLIFVPLIGSIKGI